MKTIKQAQCASFARSLVMRNYFHDYNGHFFDRDTLRFFGSRISDTWFIENKDSFLFITSEKTGQFSHERAFTVRRIARVDGQIVISDIGGFLAYPTKAQAFRALRDAL
jgi:hypothetical protein